MVQSERREIGSELLRDTYDRETKRLRPDGADRRAYETIGDIANHALGDPSMADLDDLVREGVHSKYCSACLKHHRIDVNCF